MFGKKRLLDKMIGLFYLKMEQRRKRFFVEFIFNLLQNNDCAIRLPRLVTISYHNWSLKRKQLVGLI